MKRTCFPVMTVVAVFLIFPVASLWAAEKTPAPVIVEAAQKGIKRFITESRTTGLHRFGFLTQADAYGATLGEGFQVFTVPTQSLLEEHSSIGLPQSAAPTKMWQFLVLSHGKAKAFITVDYIRDQWAPVAIGSTGLAQETADLLKRYPRSAGYHYRFLALYQADSDLIEMSKDEKVLGLVPLASARMALNFPSGSSPLEVRNFGEVAKAVRPKDMSAPGTQ